MAKLMPPTGGAQADDLLVRLNAETDRFDAGQSALSADWGASLGRFLQKIPAPDEDTTPKAVGKADLKRRTKKTPHKPLQSLGLVALMFLLCHGQELKLPQHFRAYVATGYSLGGLPAGPHTAPLSNASAGSFPHRVPHDKRRYHRRLWLGRARPHRTRRTKQDLPCGCTQ